VVTDHREIDALQGHFLVLIEAVERAHDQDGGVEPGITKSDRLLGGGDGYPVRARRHDRAGHGKHAVPISVGLDRDEHAGPRSKRDEQASHVVADGGQVYEYAASR
jgi:hypothetical protein